MERSKLGVERTGSLWRLRAVDEVPDQAFLHMTDRNRQGGLPLSLALLFFPDQVLEVRAPNLHVGGGLAVAVQ